MLSSMRSAEILAKCPPFVGVGRPNNVCSGSGNSESLFLKCQPRMEMSNLKMTSLEIVHTVQKARIVVVNDGGKSGPAAA